MSATEVFSILGQALRFAQSPEALRARAAFARGRARSLTGKLRKANKRKAKRLRKRIDWWIERATMLDERAINRERT
jgi:hypothetical protein